MDMINFEGLTRRRDGLLLGGDSDTLKHTRPTPGRLKGRPKILRELSEGPEIYMVT